MAIERLTLKTADGLALEAELDAPDGAWAGAVIAHPHPQFGGTMRSIVIGALFNGFAHAGVAALRFNFRGVEKSEGTFDDGRGERNDILAALDALHPIVEGLPLLLAGWSFGADTSLAVTDDRVAGWFAAAPPLRRPDDLVAAGDPRPKLLAVPEHDQYMPPDQAASVTASWENTRRETVAGADHYFVGRTDRLAPLGLELLEQLSQS
jgi:alpha/beta superfamily hydrolase